MSNPVIFAVSNCAGCPFAYAREDDHSDEWTCIAAADRHGFLREIGKTQEKPGGSWLPPPTWCPLRKAERVVRLASANDLGAANDTPAVCLEILAAQIAVAGEPFTCGTVADGNDCAECGWHDRSMGVDVTGEEGDAYHAGRLAHEIARHDKEHADDV